MMCLLLGAEKEAVCSSTSFLHLFVEDLRPEVGETFAVSPTSPKANQEFLGAVFWLVHGKRAPTVQSLTDTSRLSSHSALCGSFLMLAGT